MVKRIIKRHSDLLWQLCHCAMAIIGWELGKLLFL